MKLKKRVLFIRSNPVNPDPRVEKEANCLLSRGYEVEILAWDRSKTSRMTESVLNLKGGSVKISRIYIKSAYGAGFKKNLIPLTLFQLQVMNWLFKNKKRYDIIHACDFDTAYIANQCNRFLKKKFVYDIFDYYPDAFNVPKCLVNLIIKLEHKVINSANAVIICNEKRKNQIFGTTPKYLEIIHNSPEKQEKQENQEIIKSDNIKVVYVGILSDGRLLKELGQLSSKSSNLELHIAGFGKYEKYFRDLSNNFSNIYFYGRLSYNDAIQLEQKCDIMTAIYDPKIPNHYYAAPNKFYEALMLGKPLIMVKNTGMSEVIDQYQLGEIIDFNIDGLAEGIKKLIMRKEEWNNISTKSRNLYEKCYSWNEMEKRLVKLYENMNL